MKSVKKMAETRNSDNAEKKVMAACSCNKESTMQNPKKEVPIETGIESDLQTPLMFSSLSSFKQHSVHDDYSSVVSDFGPRASVIKSLTSEISKSSSRLSASQNTITNQGIQQKPPYNEHLTTKKNQSLAKIQVLDEISFQYDSAFKKPHFMKHSVFEDDIAVFKDESSPIVLSTAASSLSSLTIDDDEYGENISPNKAGLMKKKCNPINVLHMQKSHVQENWSQNSVGNTHMSSQNVSDIQAAQLYNNQHRFPVHPAENQIVNEHLNKSTHSLSYDEQTCWESQKYMRYPEQFPNDIKKSNLNLSSNQYYKDKQRSHTGAEVCREQSLFRTNSALRSQQMTDLNNCNKQDNRLMGEEEEFFEDQKGPDPRRPIKEVNHQVDEVDLNAYEEELLDQCIRKGMAKVTKRNMSDIKPFCWDLNRICLTTRAMLKPHDEELLKEKKEERIKRRLSYKGLTRLLSNSRVK